MSTHMSGFQSNSVFLHSFVLAKLATTRLLLASVSINGLCVSIWELIIVTVLGRLNTCMQILTFLYLR